MQSAPRISAPSTVDEGGTISIRAQPGIRELSVFIPGHGSKNVKVVRGRAEVVLPPDVPGGSVILISDLVVPDPYTIAVDVVGGHNR